MQRTPSDAVLKKNPVVWEFVLYKWGDSALSLHAEKTVRQLCDKYLSGRYSLNIIDIEDDIASVPPDILAVPTVVRKSPLPERRVIGGLTVLPKVITALGLDEPAF